MYCKLKYVVIYLKLLTNFVILRSFGNLTYADIYPVGSQPSRLYGTPKLHNSFPNVPPLRPTVSSINGFNYNLSKYLCNLFQPKVPSIHSTQDTFNFIKELEEVKRLQ